MLSASIFQLFWECEMMLHLVTTGFGTAVMMWLMAYLCRLPQVGASGQATFFILCACAVAGGAAAGACDSSRARGGLISGLITATLNVMVLGSIMMEKTGGAVAPAAFIWIPLFIATGGAAGLAGGFAGKFFLPQLKATVNWTSAFITVASAATLTLIAVGGMVTSMEAGLAVVDWPNSFGYNMFLYPLSRMTGGIYYEHTHRLFGSLVGITTIVFIYIIMKTDQRRAVRLAALATLPLVAVQGLMGGLRVTGVLTLSDSPEIMKPSTVLAIAHGVTGQIFFAIVLALAVVTSTTWKKKELIVKTPAAQSIQGWSAVLVSVAIIQLILGAVLRHMGEKALVHITFAVFPAMVAFACGFRAWAASDSPAPVRKVGRLLVGVTIIQFLLGILAYATIGATAKHTTPQSTAVLVATIHQVCGAIFFALTVVLALLNYRFLQAEDCGGT